VVDGPFDTTDYPYKRAISYYYRVGELVTRGQRDLAVEIIEAEIRSAQRVVLLEATKLLLTAEPVVIARRLRVMAERTSGERCHEPNLHPQRAGGRTRETQRARFKRRSTTIPF